MAYMSRRYVTLAANEIAVCIICGFTSSGNTSELFFTFPSLRRGGVRAQWLKNSGLKTFPLKYQALVCHNHFEKDCFSRKLFLKMTAVPTLNLKQNASDLPAPVKLQDSRIYVYDILKLKYAENQVISFAIDKSKKSWYEQTFDFNNTDLINIPREGRNRFVIKLEDNSMVYFEDFSNFPVNFASGLDTNAYES